ncbi:MAG TPA: FAD-dependent oxidoreductase [Acidimicrobiales bacterium]|jgi:sarcosine oxidase subunit beta|nr:FAD-dependent oxidoreductase [Actinomycetota bacterium]MDP6280822.1 FAD-dependent oxidoreductase [Acidimicrobiales bacterium]MDP7117698.1 FAD-dependent oxidoreductase [Acidimicrobiales bacterium]MDP7410975.1 FAD-dependent oxidoreductase [Acidimicrobiales bacterium]MEE1521676.1 FAD-dependent oxidoreductase [Acidimicrobiales bacterium]|tara:strand:+ start:1963 stop:3276 length:1314 start_codon:yes stop_codon:yes gene_type:complete
MSENQRYDAVIVGAGIIGTAVAFELAKKGYRTLNVDKLPTSGYGSTSNSCAIVRAHYSTYDGVAMAYEGFGYWKDWSGYLDSDDERGHALYMQSGTVLFMLKGGHHEKVLPLFDQVGVPYEVWDNATMAERVPFFEHGTHGDPTRPEDDRFWAEPEGELVGGLFTPDSGYVSDPQLATHNLQRAAEAKGATFMFRAEVAGVRQAEGRVTGITLADGTQVDAPIVVNVAGPHSFVINKMAGVYDSMNIKTRALRHEVHHVPSPAGIDFESDGLHTSDSDLAIYVRPESGNNILIGSEDPPCDPQVWVDNPDDYDNVVSDEQWNAQVLRLARRMPSLGVPNEKKGIVDLYDVSDDWIPIYDRTDLDGFYVAIGSSGNQFKNAPVAGYCMAELIDAVEKGHDHDADPLVVTGLFTGLEMNMGFYRRNREINPNSSFSVNG